MEQNGRTSENPFSSDAKKWGQVKFVPKVPKRPRPESFVNAATPWKQFKYELMEKQREVDTSNTIGMESTAAKEILKKREENYRRMLIIEQSKQPTTWETFDNQEDEAAKKKQKALANAFVKGIDLKNFDSRKLDFKQKNSFRKILTKGILETGNDLQSNVDNMKKMYSKKKKNKKQKQC